MNRPSPEKAYTTKDEFYDADKAFFQADTVLATGAGDLEKAATTVTEYALTSRDRGAMSFFLARFADFIEAGKLPPLAMRKGFRGVIAALSLPPTGGQRRRPSMSMLEREWARTHANLVAHFMNKGSSLEDAISKVEAMRAWHVRKTTGHHDLSAPKASASKIKRDYLAFRKLKK